MDEVFDGRAFVMDEVFDGRLLGWMKCSMVGFCGRSKMGKTEKMKCSMVGFSDG